ncbi:hypothetical protein ACHAWO_009304 [Cyclotella atomus]|jgi:hypothetical protein|uniref:Uncharacterized protein n=1 Tax=Cyclotella atomus TaxID=382360 RepID=A0ABD3MP20_9STRA
MISINNIVASTLLFAMLNGSNAFSYSPKKHVYRIQTALNAESSSALHYRQGNDATYAPSTLLYASDTAVEEPKIQQEEDIELQIEAALNNARDMDRRFGLCTQPSIRAWQVVDELYMKSAASQKIEDCVKSVLGTERGIWSLY